MNTTIATSSKETQTKLFDRSKDKNYIDTLINFFDNAKSVEDAADEAEQKAKDAEQRALDAFSRAQTAWNQAVEAMNRAKQAVAIQAANVGGYVNSSDGVTLPTKPYNGKSGCNWTPPEDVDKFERKNPNTGRIETVYVRKIGPVAPTSESEQETKYTMSWDRCWVNGAPVDPRNEDTKHISKRHRPTGGHFAPVYEKSKPTIVGVRYVHK